ncbi:MAG TPA: hypothetical protein VFD80_10285, partial [Flavobacteriaceae bacterium]|nr:hypothetical protein [Flavobacteriaceae bacterium]
YNAPFHVMALKGIAKLGGGNWMVVGGIDPLQQASDKVFLIHNINLSDLEKATAPPFFKVNEADDHYIIVTENIGQVVIYDIAGKTLYKSQKKLSDLYISKSQLTKGILLFVYKDEVNLPVHIKKVNP